MLEGLYNVLHRIYEIKQRFGFLQKADTTTTTTNSFETALAKAETKINNSQNSDIESVISEVSKRYGIPVELIKGIIKAESNFNPNAVSKKGAVGLMQLMPQTALELGVKNPFDISENIEGGVKYFKSLLDRFGNNLILALAAYNAGPTVVQRYGVPDYKETLNYIKNVLEFYQKYSM